MNLKQKLVLVGLSVGVLAAAGACASDDVPATATIIRELTTTLTPAQEVPPVTASSSGETRIRVRTERNLTTGKLDTSSVLVETVVSNIDSVTAGHIHAGTPGTTGPVIIGLTPTYALVRGVRVARHLPDSATMLTGALSYVAITRASAFSGTFTYDSLLARINNGTAYVNVHTIKNPGGEIRGQIVP